eukprot:UN29310
MNRNNQVLSCISENTEKKRNCGSLKHNNKPKKKIPVIDEFSITESDDFLRVERSSKLGCPDNAQTSKNEINNEEGAIENEINNEEGTIEKSFSYRKDDESDSMLDGLDSGYNSKVPSPTPTTEQESQLVEVKINNDDHT